MALSVEVTGAARVGNWLALLPAHTTKDAKKVFAKAVLDAQSEVKGNINDRSGNLARSIRTSVTGKDIDSLRASLYSAHDVGGAEVVYAPVHEFGAMGNDAIKPKNNKYAWVPGGPYLNIPEAANKTSANVMRMSATQVFGSGNASVKIKDGGGWGVFMGDVLMFSLIKKAEIRPTLGMRKAIDDRVPGVLEDIKDLIGENLIG